VVEWPVNDDPFPERHGRVRPAGLRASWGTDDIASAIPAPAGKALAIRPRYAPLCGYADHNPPVPSGKRSLLSMDGLEECYPSKPSRAEEDGSAPQERLRLRLDTSCRLPCQAPRFGGSRHLRLHFVPGKTRGLGPAELTGMNLTSSHVKRPPQSRGSEAASPKGPVPQGAGPLNFLPSYDM